MNLQEKKALFEQIKQQNFALKENQSAKEILEMALSELGNIDPYIRDNLAYEVSANIIYQKQLSNEKLREFLRRLLSDEFLFYGLEDKKHNSVFKRTFTSLIIVVFFHIPDNKEILTKELLHHLYETYLQYIEAEYDYRGFVKEKGWAHFFAHSSDVFNCFFAEPSFNEKLVFRYLRAIKSIIQNTQHVFHHNEDERFKKAFIVLIARNELDHNLIKEFLINLTIFDRENHLPEDLITYVNVKNVLKELYVSLDQNDNDTLVLIKDLIDKLNINC